MFLEELSELFGENWSKFLTAGYQVFWKHFPAAGYLDTSFVIFIHVAEALIKDTTNKIVLSFHLLVVAI